MRPRALLAAEGKGEFTPGAWCRFCPARAQCTARARKMLELEALDGAQPEGAPHGPDSVLLTDAEIGEVLSRAKHLAAWVADLESYALSAALEGKRIAGWKAVEGRGTRNWTDLDTAFRILQKRGVAEALLWERKPVTVPALEKALGKKTFADAADGLWSKLPGKPTLVPDSDKRPPYNPAGVAFQAVTADG